MAPPKPRKYQSLMRKPDAFVYQVASFLKLRCVNDSDIIPTSVCNVPGTETCTYTEIARIDGASFGRDMIIKDFFFVHTTLLIQPHY